MKKIEQLEIIAKDLLAEIEKLKQSESDNINKDIDLANTWCEATEENYNALIKLYDIIYTCSIQDVKYYEILRNSIGRLIINAVSYYEDSSKQIHLVNGEFQYVENVEETKDSNNKINEVLYEYDLEINFNGYPLESTTYIISNEIKEYLIEEEFKRYPKNKKYRLILTLEEYE